MIHRIHKQKNEWKKEKKMEPFKRKDSENSAERSIRHCLFMLAPEPEAFEEGKRELFDFFRELYQAMYEDPERFLVFPKPYEDYVCSHEKKAAAVKKEKAHETDARESTLRNAFQQEIQFYAKFFYLLGVEGTKKDEEPGSFFLSLPAFEAACPEMNRIHDRQNNELRYQLIREKLLQIRETNAEVNVAFRNRTKAADGLLFLCHAPEGKYKWMNYLRLDFKNAYEGMPSIQDVAASLPESKKQIVERMQTLLSGQKVKVKLRPLRGIVSDFKWKAEFTYRGNNICGFYADDGYFMLCIYFNNFKNINDFAKELYENAPAMFQWFQAQFPERLCKCPSNRRVFFGEEPRRICGMSNRAEIVNPTNEDVERAINILCRYRKIAREESQNESV